MLPPTRRDDTADVLHGVTVPDPYRWLEDGDDPAVRDWVDAQNAVTRALLDARPDRAVWHTRLVELLEVPVVLDAEVRGGLLVTLERARGQQQASLVCRQTGDPGATPLLLADPSAGTDDAAAAVDWFATSDDGALVAYGVSEGGTENSVLRVVRTADATLLAEEIPNTRACSVAWEPDGSGFFYTRYPPDDDYHRTVHHHRLGADWHDDPVVWAEHPTPQTWPNVTISPDGRHLLVAAMVGWSRYDQHLLDRTDGTWHTLIEGVDAITGFEFGGDGFLYGTTTVDAPRGRVVRLPVESPPDDPAAWTTIVEERDVVVGTPVVSGGDLLVTATRRAVDSVERWSTDGTQLGEVPGLGTVAIEALAAERSTPTAFVLTAGFHQPATLWRIEPDGEPNRWLPAAGVASGVPDLVVDEVDYESTDGTTIGMFLVHQRGATLGADTPTILTGYGGFAISYTPAWSPLAAAWCSTGGVYAVAGLRGGLEHGEEWHLAGKRDAKQRVFDDFHAAADWLVGTRRTSRDRLAIAGGSNGGLLVGAALTQRPDLARAVWCAVPLLDMVRFPQFLIARLWTEEYGDPDVAEEFAWLHAYSPYHQVRKDECYPPVLLTTAEGDTRVDPMHARKMAAILQWATSCESNPVLLHQEGRAGHGVGKPVGKRAAEAADVLTFFSWQLGIGP